MISGRGSCCYLQPTLAGAGKSVFAIAVNFAREGLPSMILPMAAPAAPSQVSSRVGGLGVSAGGS